MHETRDVESAEYYDALARECCYTESYRRNRWVEYFHLLRRIGGLVLATETLAAKEHFGTAVDVGCGDGILLPALSRAAREVTAIDISSKRLNQAREATQHLPNISYEVQDIMANPLSEKKKYDLVVCSEVVEHVRWPEEFFRCLASLVAPSGYLILSTPSRWGFREKSLRLQQIALNLWDNRIRGRNVNRWRFYHVGLLSVSQLRRLAAHYFPSFELWTAGFYLPVITELGFTLGGDRWRQWYERLDNRAGHSPLLWINWTQMLVAKQAGARRGSAL